jgi:AraC-like DNA-binding protein
MYVESGERSVPFEGQLTFIDLGPVIVSRASSTPAIIHRAGITASRSRDRDFVVSLPIDNGMSVCTAHWDRYVGVDEMLITDAAQTGVVTHTGCTVISLRISDQLFRQYLPDGENLAGVVLNARTGAGMLAATIMRALIPDEKQRFAVSSSNHVAQSLLHAIAATCAETTGLKAAPASFSSTRRGEIIRFVEAHLNDTDLSVQSVAQAFDLSERYLRLLFSDTPESLSVYMRRRQLEECARQLRDPRFSTQSISDIAYSWGFNSLGSFDRAFKAKFAMTPRRYRAACH